MSLRETIILFILNEEVLSPQRIYEEYRKKDAHPMPIGSLHTTLVRMSEKGLLNRVNKKYSLSDLGKEQLFTILKIFNIPQMKNDLEKYRTFFNQLADPALVTDGLIEHKTETGEKFIGPGTITDANDAACKKFGFTREEFRAMTPLQFEFSETFHKHINLTLERLSKFGETNFESVFFTKSHQPIHIEANSKVFEWDGKPQNVTILRDITNRKIIEKEIAETIERLKLAMWGTDLGIWDWDLVTNVVNYSPRWAEQLGYKVEELEPTYKTWEDNVHPDDLPNVLITLESHFRGEVSYYESDFRMRKKTGEWVHIRARGKVVARDPDGKPLRATGTHKVIEGMI